MRIKDLIGMHLSEPLQDEFLMALVKRERPLPMWPKRRRDDGLEPADIPRGPRPNRLIGGAALDLPKAAASRS